LVVDAYNLNIRPTKRALKEHKLSHLRDAAKRVIYGLSYGATSFKIYETLSLEGIDITIDQVNKLIESLMNNYQKRFSYNEMIKEWIKKEDYLVNCYGRVRHFEKINRLISSSKNDVSLHAEREAVNFIPQSTVADVMNQVLSKIFFDESINIHAKILLQIHDEVLLSCKKEFADYVSNKVVSIIKSVPIFRCHFDGTRLDDKNYYFGAGVSVAPKWSKD
jgi:DNA polymerase-1